MTTSVIERLSQGGTSFASAPARLHRSRHFEAFLGSEASRLFLIYVAWMAAWYILALMYHFCLKFYFFLNFLCFEGYVKENGSYGQTLATFS